MITALAPAFSEPSVYGGPAGRVHHGYSTAKAKEIAVQLDLSKSLSNAWYAKLEPGGFIVSHIDQGPWVERWHYPISGDGYVWQVWYDVAVAAIVPAARSYRMYHNRLHAVWNPSNVPRVILIVEYDKLVDQPTTDLIIGPMIPQIQEMIDAL